MDTKAVENVKKLEEQLATARETAKNGFLAAVNETLAQLEAIGFKYELRAADGAVKTNGKVCSNCGLAGHNSRSCSKKTGTA